MGDRRPSRLNVEPELFADPRYQVLVEKVGRFVAGGMILDFWRLAQGYYKTGCRVPKDLFELGGYGPLLAVGLAKEEADGIRAAGEGEQFGWLRGKAAAGAEGGRKSGEARRSKTKQNEASRSETNPPSPSPSPSPPPTPSRIGKEECGRAAPPHSAATPSEKNSNPLQTGTQIFADLDPPATVSPKGEVAELAERTAPELDGDLRRLPFGDPDILDFLEAHNVPPKVAHGWVRAFGNDQPACEAALRGVVLKLISRPDTITRLEVQKKPMAAYLTGAMVDEARGRPSTVMKPLQVPRDAPAPFGPAPQSVADAKRIAEDKRIADEAARRVREEDERAKKATERLPPEERKRRVKALIAGVIGKTGVGS